MMGNSNTKEQQRQSSQSQEYVGEAYKELDADGVVDKLDTDQENGLSGDEAASRLDEHGPNSIEGEEESTIKKLLSNFWGPIPWMLEAATVLAVVARRWEEFGVIFIMLLINGGVSFWHENKAENAVQALKEKLAPTADAIRNGEQQEVDAKELVPGDVVILRMGDVVPADAMVIGDNHVSIDESALTGESMPIDKEQGDLCYSGTSVKRGEARAVIIATGAETRFAQTVELVEAAEQESHFQKAMLRIGYFLIGATAILVVIMVLIEILLRHQEWTEVLLFAMVLTIAGIPQALPAVLTVTMTVGANRLADMKAIVAKLSAMEEMAGLEVLCADKTGTLTLNQLTLQESKVFAAGDERELLIAAGLTIKQDEEGDDPIDQAVMDGLEDKDALSEYDVKELRPFDPTRKRAEADVSRNGDEMRIAKGAPQVILELVEPDEDTKQKVNDAVDELGKDGYRALGVARKRSGESWEYLGLLSLLDPPRDDAADVISDAQAHHIDIRMVTGDHAAIAKQVADQVGLGQNILDAREVFGEHGEKTAEEDTDGHGKAIGEETLKADGFAGVTPEHKFSIIKSFQKTGRIVGMTGDGVNDAPALKQADVGIAVEGATDAARAAAALVLTEKGLGVITHAVEEARRIFERMTGYATFRIAETMRVLLFVTGSILAFQFYPVTPIMIVLLAILNDIPIMMIANDNVPTAKRPVRWDMKRVLSTATVLSITGVASTFLLLWYLETQTGFSQGTIQSMIFLKLLVAGHMTIFITRNDGWFWQKPWPNWLLFVTLEGTQIIGTLVAVYGWLIPEIGWGHALAVWAYALVWFPINNAAKVITRKILNA